MPGLTLNGHPERRLPNTLNVSFPGLDGEELLARTPGHRGVYRLGLPRRPHRAVRRVDGDGHQRERALGAVRLSLGYPTTEAEVDCCCRGAHRDRAAGAHAPMSHSGGHRRG